MFRKIDLNEITREWIHADKYGFLILERTKNIRNNMICFLNPLKLKNRPLAFCIAVVFSNVNLYFVIKANNYNTKSIAAESKSSP